MTDLEVKQGSSLAVDEARALEEVAGQTGREGHSVVVLFCSPAYDLDRLGPLIAETFDSPVVGCTSAGEIATPGGYQSGGMVGIGLNSSRLVAHPRLIAPLSEFTLEGGQQTVQDIEKALTGSSSFDPERNFAFFLIDWLSHKEEVVTSVLHQNLNRIPLFGGSASDRLTFDGAYVYHQGRFHSDAALLTVFESGLPFEVFRMQHYRPVGEKVVITEADSPSRRVYEINGKPAAQEYARLLGLNRDDLTPPVYARNPVMLALNDEFFIRSVMGVNDDDSLTFACAIEKGLVLQRGEPGDAVENIRTNLAAIGERLGHVDFLLGCDCMWRKLEFLEEDLLEEVAGAFGDTAIAGFSSYGEQYNGLHVNQTLTGLALGR